MSFSLLSIVKAKSKLELAGRIRSKWLELAPEDKRRIPSEISISNRLGDLEQDKPSWWESDERPAARRAFEEVTGVLFQDLPLTRPAISISDVLGTRPFYPEDEAPAILSDVNWFQTPTQEERRWIVAPPGSGRTFAVQWHRLRQVARATEVRHLLDAAKLFDTDGPLVIGVEAPDPENDEMVLRRLDARGAVLVIASFVPSRLKGFLIRDAESPSLGLDADELDRDRDDNVANNWLVQQWRPRAGWQEDLVNWLALRIADGGAPLDPDEIGRWLRRVDNAARIFRTPSDVVAICAHVRDFGVPGVRRDLAEQVLQKQIERAASLSAGDRAWFRTWGVAVVKSLVDGRIDRFDLSLWEPLSREAWIGLLPDHLAPRSLTDDEIDTLLDARRTPKKDARDKLRRRPGPEVVDLLTSARFLRPQGSGLALCPHWIAAGLARDLIGREIMDGSVDKWGRWAVDPQRRDLVDAELDELKPETLFGLAERVVRVFVASSLGTVGAVEALFSAIGRRLAPKLKGPEILRPLAELQRSLLTTRFSNGVPLAPRTRRGFDSDGEWLACCWSWSLYGPSMVVDSAASWLFPGWHHPTIEQTVFPHEVNAGEPGWTGREPTNEPVTYGRAFLRLLEMSFDVLSRCESSALPAQMERLFVPALVLTAHRRPTAWTGDLPVTDLLGTRWGADFLVRQARPMSHDERAKIAKTLWAALFVAKRGAFARYDMLRTTLDGLGNRQKSELMLFIDENLPPEDFANALQPDDLHLLHRLLDLPPSFRVSLVCFALDQRPDGLPHLASTLNRSTRGRIGAADAPWLQLLADQSNLGWRFRQELWRVLPDQMLANTLAASLTESMARELYLAAPNRFHGALIRNLHAPLPGWAVLWLRHRVLDAGADADHAYQLLNPPGP